MADIFQLFSETVFHAIPLPLKLEVGQMITSLKAYTWEGVSIYCRLEGLFHICLGTYCGLS